MTYPTPYILTYTDGETRIVYEPYKLNSFSLHVVTRCNGDNLRAVQISSDLIEKVELEK